MKPLVLTLRTNPDERLDLSALVPHRLSGRTADEIARLELQTGRQRVTVGDIFRVRGGDSRYVRIEGGTDRFDQVGQDMTDGEIVVEGEVGSQAGRSMAGGRLVINGDAGGWAASGMRGGHIEIAGSAGDRLGGPLAGEVTGMRGGVVVVRGDVGDRAGDRLRRGTIVLADGCDELSPTFLDCGVHDFIVMRLMAAFVRDYSAVAAAALRSPLRRLAGDMAVLGKGEILCACA